MIHSITVQITGYLCQQENIQLKIISGKRAISFAITALPLRAAAQQTLVAPHFVRSLAQNVSR